MALKFISEAASTVPAAFLATLWVSGWVYISAILRRVLNRRKI